ncbi:MAG: AAA family ATPase [Deinococcota bacterium]
MQLVSLTLAGFKSFADKTTLPLQDGINAIVGPNGSGKSNVIDALRWATGGGRAKEYRAEDQTDLIFHGAKAKKTLGYAEVDVCLEHDGKPIVIRRSIYRDGQSKLKLAGKNARFLDLDELLAGSGLGRSGLAVIGQGEVSSILTASPETLLASIAEAAGISRLGQRRDKTSMRLSQAEDHLAEVDKQLAQLREQQRTLLAEARHAFKATALKRTVLQLRYSLAKQRTTTLDKEREKLEARVTNLETTLQDSTTQLDQAQQTWDNARAQVSDAEVVLHKIVTQIETHRGDVRVAEAEVSALETQVQQLTTEKTRLEADIHELDSLSPPSPPDVDSTQAQRDLLTARTALEAVASELVPLQQRYDSLLIEIREAETRAQQYQRAVEVYQSRKIQLERDLAGVQAHLNHPDNQVQQDVAALEATYLAAKAVVDGFDTTLTAARKHLQDAQQTRANAAAEALALQREVDRLSRAFNARQGYAKGPRAALTMNHPDVHGAVADLIGVPSEYKQAISSALGRRSENVVIGQSAAASDILTHVRGQGGYVTLLPLDLLNLGQVNISPQLLAEGAVVGIASDLIEVDDAYHIVALQLLGRTVIVRSLDDATHLAKRYARRPRLVSLAGDIVESYGAISGGRTKSGAYDDGRISQRDVDAATRALDTVQQQVEAANQVCDQLAGELESLTTNYTQAGRAFTDARDSWQHAAQAEAVRASRQQDRETSLATITQALANLIEPSQPEQDTDSLVDERDKLERTLSTLRHTRDKRQEHYQACDKVAALVSEQQRAFTAAKQSYDANLLRLTRYQDDHKAIGQRLINQQDALKQARDKLVQRQAAVPDDSAVRHALTQTQTQLQDAQNALQQASRVRAQAASGLEQTRLSLVRKQAACEAAAHELSQFPEGLNVLLAGTTISLEDESLEGDGLVDGLVDELFVDTGVEDANNISENSLEAVINESEDAQQKALESVVSQWDTVPEAVDANGGEVKPQEPLRELHIAITSAKALKDVLELAEQEREALGPVNHRAQVALAEVREHYDEMATGVRDASDAVSTLREALGELDGELNMRLEHAVAAVRIRFQQRVHDLFGDTAEADVRLLYETTSPKLVDADIDDVIGTPQPSQPQPTGVKLSLQPPNKSTQSLNLLSVGERTMGAMAFLFALMEGDNALPIAILDEVDAPLDEANIRRFRDFVSKLAKQGTQFLLITHQKATMECADVLWGVTTQGGVSRVFSIRKDEALGEAAD